MAKQWIAGAIKHPGALHKQLGVPQGQTIPEAKLAKAAQAGGTLGKRARLAETLKGFHSHLPKGVGLSPTGDIGQHRQVEAKVLEGKFFAAGGGGIVSSSKTFTSRHKGSIT